MDNQFISISDVMYDIKEKITDGEYMSIMQKLSNIRLKYNTDILNQDICECIAGESKFCTGSLDKFIICKNLNYIITQFPMLRNLIIYKAIPKQDFDFIYNIEINEPSEVIEPNELYIQSINYQNIVNHFIICNISFEPNNVDISYISDNIETQNIIIKLRLLIELSYNVFGKFCKMIITIAIYDYNFRHFGFLKSRYKYLETVYNKLQEFSINTNNRDFMIIINLIKNICDIDENPYVLFYKNMAPYYIEAFNIEQHRLQMEIEAEALEIEAEALGKPIVFYKIKPNITFDTEQISLQEEAEETENTEEADKERNANAIDEIDEPYTNDKIETGIL